MSIHIYWLLLQKKKSGRLIVLWIILVLEIEWMYLRIKFIQKGFVGYLVPSKN